MRNDSRPPKPKQGWYHFRRGNYCNVIDGASPVNIYYSTDNCVTYNPAEDAFYACTADHDKPRVP